MSDRLARCLVLLGLVACSKKGEPDNGPPAPAAGSVTCLDLPGASRSALTATEDGAKVLFLERASKNADTNLVSVDLATRKATTVVENVGEDSPLVVGGKVLYVAAGPKSDAGYHGPGRLVARDLASGAETVLAESALQPRAFVVDRKTQSVFFVGTEAGAKDGFAFQTSLAGGAPKKIGPAILIWAVEADGKSLVVRGRDKEATGAFATETDRLALDGTVTKLGPNGYSVTPVDALLVYAAGDDTSPLQVRSAGGTVDAVLGSHPKDALFVNNRIAARAVHDGTDLYVVKSTLKTPASLDLLVTLRGVGVEAAVRLPNGGLMILATQDTNGDGKFSSDDEHDVCVLGPHTAPIAIPKRDAPKRYATMLPALREAAAKDLPGASVKLGEDRVRIEIPGEGDQDWEALREKVRAFYKHAVEITKSPKLTVDATHAAGNRAATCDVAACRVGVAGVAWLEDRSAHDVALESKGFRDIGISGIKYRCAGTVTNASAKPLRTSVVCDLVAREPGGKKVVLSKHFDVEALAAKASAKFDLDLGASDAALAGVVSRVLIDGKEVEPLVPSAEAKALAWLMTTESIRKNTGFMVRPREAATSLDTHAGYDVPKGFGAMTDDARNEQVKKLRAELLAFNKKADPSEGNDTGLLSLYEDGTLKWFLNHDGKLDATSR